MAYQISELTRRIQLDPVEFLAECDQHYAQRVSLAADKILGNMERSPIVLLSGPSGSGKTTTAVKIANELKRRGVNSHPVAMDNYFRTVNPATAPRTPEGDYDFESPLCMDMSLLTQHFEALGRGEEVLVPKYEFSRQMRNDAMGKPLKLGKNEIAIFEGIHALNDDITANYPQATRLYVSARSNISDGATLRFKGTWVRLSRRAVRDLNFRGKDMTDTMIMWENVRRGEKLYISPFKNKADILFDSVLPYEISVMANFAHHLREEIPQENVRRQELLDMVDAFQYFEPIDPSLVAPNSLLREFIGGASYSVHD